MATVSANVYLGHDAETDSDVYADEYNIPQYNLYQTQVNLHFVKNGEDTYKPVLVSTNYSKTTKNHTKIVYRYGKNGTFIKAVKNHWSEAMVNFLRDKKRLPKEWIYKSITNRETHFHAFDRVHIDMSKASEGWVGVNVYTFSKPDIQILRRDKHWFTRKNGYYYMKTDESYSTSKIGYNSPFMIIASWLNSNGYM
jgi:hypothetical protein